MVCAAARASAAEKTPIDQAATAAKTKACRPGTTGDTGTTVAPFAPRLFVTRTPPTGQTDLRASRGRASAAVASLVIVVGGAARSARSEPVPEDSGPPVLGQLEQESVGDALARLGLAIDPAPQGKIIGRIHVVAHEVFSPRDGRLQWFNLFHRTTRPGVLGRELLLAPGQLYDEALIDESTRNIQSPLPFVVAGRQLWPPDLSSVVAIVPVRSPIPGHVDLLLVTRDLWSLRFNSDF